MGHSYRRVFSGNCDIFFAQFFNPPYFPDFFFPNKCVKFNELGFLLLENFTNSDRTPPKLDTYLQLFPNFGIYGKNDTWYLR